MDGYFFFGVFEFFAGEAFHHVEVAQVGFDSMGDEEVLDFLEDFLEEFYFFESEFVVVLEALVE